MEKKPEKATVLIVDDEADIRELLAEVLESYRILRAEDGLSGLEIARRERPDVIVSDIRMPRMTGLQMLEALRREKIEVPVILVTGFSETAVIDAAWKLGAYDFMDKPIDFEKLAGIVKSAVEFGGALTKEKFRT